MKKLIFCILLISLLFGCGSFEKSKAHIIGHSEECIGGVVYYQFPTGASVGYNMDGSIKTCK